MGKVLGGLFYIWGLIGGLYLFSAIGALPSNVGIGTSGYLAMIGVFWVGGLLFFGLGAILATMPMKAPKTARSSASELMPTAQPAQTARPSPAAPKPTKEVHQGNYRGYNFDRHPNDRHVVHLSTGPADFASEQAMRAALDAALDRKPRPLL